MAVVCSNLSVKPVFWQHLWQANHPADISFFSSIFGLFYLWNGDGSQLQEAGSAKKLPQDHNMASGIACIHGFISDMHAMVTGDSPVWVNICHY